MFCAYLHICTSVPIRLKLLIASLLVKTLHTKHPVSLKTFWESLLEVCKQDTENELLSVHRGFNVSVCLSL